MKKLFLRSASLLTAAALAAGIMPAAAMAADNEVYTLSNNYIKVEVSGKNGGFHIDTVQGDKLEKDDDNKMLLHNSSEYDTSFTSFRITKNGESNDYIFGRGYGFLGLSVTDITTVKDGNRIVSTWTVEDIEITQNIELANDASAENGMVVITYTAQNNGDTAADVDARIMLDTALGYQDYAYYMIPEDGSYRTIENEQIIDGASYGHMMFGYNDEFTPSITAYTVNASVNSQECVPEQVAFGHWNNLASTVYDFTPNESLTFTNEYNAQYLTADSAYALYFDAGTIEPGGSGSIATNYGVYSNASTDQTAKMSINISGADPLQLNADKTAYVSPTGGTEGEITLTAVMKNFERDGAETLDNVKIVVYPDERLIPVNSSGSSQDANGEDYSSSNPYSVDLVNVQVDQTITENFRFKVPVSDTASYRKVELVAYEMGTDSDVLLQEDIIGRQNAYSLCPGTDNGVPEVVLTGCTEYMYFSGKQRLSVTGTNFNMLGDAGSYNFRLEQITENGKDGAVINIDSANAVVDEINNTIDLTVPAEWVYNNRVPKEWPLGTYRVVIDYTDDAKEDVVSDAAKVIVTNDPKYMNSGYGVLTIEQTVQPTANEGVAACRYGVNLYRTEEEYNEYVKNNPDAEILVVLKGDFSEARRDGWYNTYYEATVVESNGEPVNPVTLNDTMELRSGSIRVKLMETNNWGDLLDESEHKILVDIDGDMRMAGTGTVIYNGTAALTEIQNGRDYDLRKYTTDGIRCSTLSSQDPRYQNMSNKETITYVFSKVFDTFVSLAGIVNADLTFGELGSMVDTDNDELTKLVSFGARVDLGVVIPKGSKEFKEKFDSAWVAYRKELMGATGSAFSNLEINNSDELRSTWKDFKNTDYSTQYAARRSRGLIAACAEIEDVLFGGGDFIGVNFSVDIGVPPLTTTMPGISGTLSVNTMGDWRFGVDGYAEFGGLTVEATIEIVYSNELGAPIPNTLYLFIQTPPPGLNIDGFGVIWLRGGGGGINNLYEAVYCPATLPSTSIALSISASIIQVLTAKIDLELGLTGVSIIADRAVINETEIEVLRNSGISFQWYPSFKFTGQVNVDLLGILRGGGYIVVDPGMDAYEFYATVSLMFPGFIPIVGGKTVGSVGVGINQDKIWGKATIIGLTFGVLYYWGGDFSFEFGDSTGLAPSYPELMSMNDVAVAYDEDTGRTLYAHVIPNYGLAARAQTADQAADAVPQSNSENGVKLLSNADKTEHTLNLGTYEDSNGALNIAYSAESEEQAYELARQVSITSGGSTYPITILEDDESNADTANAFVAFTPSETEGEPGEARLVVSFTDDSDFDKGWTITTPVSSALELYNVSKLPEFSSYGTSFYDNKVSFSWTMNDGELTDIEKISVYAVPAENYDSGNETDGVFIGTITDQNILTSGYAELELPEDMPTGTYYIRIVADHSENLIDSVVSAYAYQYTNPNQPQSASVVTAANAGDYMLRVGLEEPDENCGGYIVNLYEVGTGENGQIVYTELDNMSGIRFDADDELLVGGRYEFEPDRSDPEAPTETQYIGLEPGMTYAVGVCRVNYITDEEGNTTAEVMSEETFSGGVVLSQPTTPNVSASVSAADGTAAVDLSAGMAGDTEIFMPTVGSADVNVTLTSDMPVSGTWYLDNISYDVAKEEADQGGRQGTYGEFSTGDGNTAVISMTGLDTQQHALHIEGTNAAGDGFTQTVNFSVDTEAPTLVLNEPLNGSLTADDKITIAGRTDLNAVLKVEVNGEIIGEKQASEWEGMSDNGSFEFTVPADPNIMKNKIVVTASDAMGNETKTTSRVVNERMSELAGVRLFFNGVDVTNTQMDSGIAASGALELRGVTKSGETFVINDDTNIEWSLYAVNGNAQITENGIDQNLFDLTGNTLTYDKNSRGMVLGMFRLTETAGMSAAASYGARSTHQITYDVPAHGHITVEPENATAGDTVTVTFIEQDGYPFRGWSANNASVTFADASALTTTFVMPDDDVHITAAFKTPSSTVTPPAAKDLTYNGEAQELVTAGTAVGGTMMYRLGENGEFSTEIPTATEAGDYTVYYMVADPEGTTSTEPQSIKVTIKTSDSETTVEGTDVTYGDTLTLTANVKRAEPLNIAVSSNTSMFADTNKVNFYANGNLLETADVVYDSDNSDSGTAVLEINTGNKQLALGINTIKAEYGGSVNLNGSNSGEITVNMKAKPIEYTVSADNKTYDGTTAVNVTLTPTGLVKGDSVTITATGNLPSANAGDYTTVDLTDVKLDGAQASYYTASETAQSVPLTATVTVSTSAETTAIGIDYKNMTLTGFVPGSVYTVNGSEITAETDTLAIADEWFGTELSIIKKASDGNHSDSAAQTVSVPARPESPEGVQGVNSRGSSSAGKMTGLNDTMEYRLTPDGEWIRAEGDTVSDLEVGTYEVRIAASDSSFPGEPVSITIRRSSSSGGSGGGSGVQTPTSTAAPTETPAETTAPTETAVPAETSEPTASAELDLTQQPGTEDEWFEDVTEDKWYYDPIKNAVENGLMNGVSDTSFDPETDITRAMFVTVLYRMEGSPETEPDYTFTDVQSDSYYAEAVAWADDNGIVQGYSAEEFGPDDTITREQMAAIIYRYAAYLGEDTSAAQSTACADADAVSDYAKEAVDWITGMGIMQGRDGNVFAPADHTTRAEAAAVFDRTFKLFK